MNNGEQVNDHIEEDDHTDTMVEDDDINTLIHDAFNVRMDDDDDDDDDDENDDFDVVHDLPLLRRDKNPFMRDPTQIFSLLYC